MKSLFYTGVKALALTSVLATLGSVSAYAVTGIQAGQTITGNLSSQSLNDEYDDTLYDLYLYQGVPGEYVQIDMTSSALDSYLIAGGSARNAPDCADCEVDDDGGEELNSRLVYIVPEGGNVYIRAGEISHDFGRYTLSTKRLDNPSIPEIQTLRLGSTQQGRLNDSSAISLPGKYFDLYMLRGEPNALVNVMLQSEDFDTYLAEVSIRGTQITEIDSNDDANFSDSSTDSRLKIRLDDTGKAIVQATSYGNMDTGRYTLRALPINEAREIKAERRLRPGQSVNDSLEASGPAYLGDYYFDAYSISGVPGERVIVEAHSDDFDTVLNWGYMENGEFVIAQSNDDADDSSSGTDSKMTLVLDREGNSVLMITSYQESSTGDYYLTVE